MAVGRKLSLGELRSMTEKFVSLSTDFGKTIKKEDALILLRALGQNPSQKEFHQSLNESNLTSYSHISQEQFQSLAQRIWRDDSAEATLAKAFKKFDKNGDGYVDLKEFKEVMTRNGEPLSHDEFDELVNLVDTDDNGKISYNEFIKTISKID